MSASDRTEKPTPRRLEKARSDGSFVTSRDFISAVTFLIFSILLLDRFPAALASLVAHTRGLMTYAFAARDLSGLSLTILFRQYILSSYQDVLISGLWLATAAVVAQLLVSRLGFSTKNLQPQLRRLNPAPRAKEVLTNNAKELARSLLLLPALLLLSGYFLYEHAPVLNSLSRYSWQAGIAVFGEVFGKAIEGASYLFLVLGFVAWAREQRRYNNQLKMSKQEIRDENKEMEGNPQIKARVRRLQRERSRRRNLADVPTASAVIVNPTHYAVAIRYDYAAMAVPKVVAKGRNHVAQRIRQMAIRNEVPIVENPPLARALFAAADVGQEIPPHLYKAVAEVLAYLHRLLGARMSTTATR